MNPTLAWNTDPQSIDGFNKIQTVIGYASWVASGIAVMAMIAAGATMAISYRRGDQPGRGVMAVIAGCILLGAAGPLASKLTGVNLFTSNPQAIPGMTGVQTVISIVAFVAAGVCVLAVIAAAVKIIVSWKNGEDYGHLASVLAGCVVVGSAATIVGAVV